ncbi:hypothetical protein [Chitinophaga sancti]|uniref:Uncharacterized protein n=1 Tax=Chitinophaga sancti TaxID=1004 RepID=A0A1K1RQY8_9BACT|nr:hypothetical protein [Chitinophaga sancti]WQD62523.1 hypothetical protein U0033_32025 [Chitinophaga sancti]WQG91908.1 hypothetical protein SR876_10360 [Chitinophaga sancti]SFW74151.1 hypothetical protein SAMN05661012_04109 [Chitinophaga sancti]
MIKKITLLIVALIVVSLVIIIEGSIPKMFARKKMIKLFTENEKAFLDLETFFLYNTNQEKLKTIEFGLDDGRGTVSFYVGLDSVPEVLGNLNETLTSPALEPALAYMGWTFERLRVLGAKLERIKCHHIIFTRKEDGGYVIALSPDQTGYDFFSFYLLDAPIRNKEYDGPIGESDFGKRVGLLSNAGFSSE